MNEIASRQSSVLLLLMQREEEQHIQCGWHLKFCADLTRTAPLGSQSGVYLFRRYLSSPWDHYNTGLSWLFSRRNRRLLEKFSGEDQLGC